MKNFKEKFVAAGLVGLWLLSNGCSSCALNIGGEQHQQHTTVVRDVQADVSANPDVTLKKR